MDELILDPDVLDEVADSIEAYCESQNQILDDYCRDMVNLQGEWDDDHTFGNLMREIEVLRTRIHTIIEEISATYPRYFRDKALEIVDRTTGIGIASSSPVASTYSASSPVTASANSGATSASTPPKRTSTAPSTSAPSATQSADRLEKGEFISDGIRPTKLNRTRQTWQRDGYVKTFNTPKQTGEKLNSNQGVPVSRGGEGVEGFEGTCGLVSVENILRMAGVNITEEKVVNYARTHKIIGFKGIRPMCTIDSSPENNGGTYAKDRQAVLRHFGIESDIEYGSVEKIAEYVEQGRGVIAIVDANMLWYQSHGSVPAFHAITITSIQRDAHTNEITGVYVCDSGDRGESSARLVPVEVMRFALAPTGAEMNITKTIIR